MKIVKITWEDSNCIHGWHTPMKYAVDKIVSVGLLAAEDKNAVTIIQGRGSQNSHNALTIPRSAIKEMVTLIEEV